MSFLQIGVYRRKYWIYAITLFVLTALLCFMVVRSVIDSRVAAFAREAQRAFGQVEDNLERNADEIERYVLKVYGAPELAEDMMDFLGRDMESYLSMRLERVHGERPLSPFLDDVRAFAAIGGRKLFIQISLHTPDSANVILLAGDDGRIECQVPNTAPLFAPDIATGITYTRKLVSPGSIHAQVGEIRFTMGSATVFGAAERFGLTNLRVVDTQGSAYTALSDGTLADAAYEEILAQGANQGTLRSELLLPSYYAVYTSDRFGYRVVAAMSSATLLAQTGAMLFFVLTGSVLLLVTMLLLIGANMHQEAQFFTEILRTIGQAKEGQFTAIRWKKRRDNEYRLIAGELNDMYKKLQDHIRREYLFTIKQQETEMRALQHQINPHFLYNTLETLRGLAVVHKDGQLADAIACLGAMYRGMAKTGLVVTVEEEIATLTAYLHIMELRHDGKFFYQIRVEPEVSAIRTVKFWLQPLAENFFVHGFDEESGFNLLLIQARAESDAYVVEMINNGSAIDPQRLTELNALLRAGDEAPQEGGRQGIGLRNVYTRLRHFHGEACTMTLENNKEAGITITVRIQRNNALEEERRV